MSLRRNYLRTQEDIRQRERFYRERGFEDGYANRPAASQEAVYQAAWRQGRAAREADKRV